MKQVLIATFAFCAVTSSTAFAQSQQPAGYHSVACIKVLPGKGAAFRDFMKESRRITQVLADEGRMTAAYRLRFIMPAGEAASCDYAFVTVYQGAPPAPLGPDALPGYLTKAGVTMSATDYIARRDSVSKLVSSEMWQTAIAVGEMQKGDYAFVNHMQVHDDGNYMELERSVWKPMAESMIKQGKLRGWLVARPVVPAGTSLKYQAVSVDVAPTWDAVFSDWEIAKLFKQVHPDMDANQVLEKIGKARDLALRELVVVDDKIVPSTKASGGGGE